jgi:predicted CXXCH cytochrome family protein
MKPQRSTSPRIYVLLLLVATGVSIALTPAARGRIDESALKLTGADAALFNLAHDCTYCHGLHGGDPDQLLQNTIVEDLCRSCHDGSFDPDGPGGPLPPAPVATVHTNDPTGNSCCGPFQVTCNECHDPHSNQENHCSGSGPTAACPFGDHIREPGHRRRRSLPVRILRQRRGQQRRLGSGVRRVSRGCGQAASFRRQREPPSGRGHLYEGGVSPPLERAQPLELERLRSAPKGPLKDFTERGAI